MSKEKNWKPGVQARKWALILGGSSGLGLATAKKLAREGFHLFIIHRDRRADLPEIDSQFENIRSMGVQCRSFNADALNPEKRSQLLEEIQGVLGDTGKISVLVHSIAKGHVKSMTGKNPLLTARDLMLTLDAMAVSWYAWTRALLDAGLFAKDSRVLAFTSEGNHKVIPSYAAVSAAKAALEALCRNMAVELASLGIKVNCIQAGVTETPSFEMIPNSDQIRAFALKRNPSGRLTTAGDVANVVYLLTTEEAGWITGTVIKADGGESLR